MPPGVDSAGAGSPLRHPNESRPTCKNDGRHVIFAKSRSAIMLDLVYILIGVLLFVACWASTKACDRL
jgi:hypothetical protein